MSRTTNPGQPRPGLGMAAHEWIWQWVKIRKNAGGGNRTHTLLRELDFESSASASSATPAMGSIILPQSFSRKWLQPASITESANFSSLSAIASLLNIRI